MGVLLVQKQAADATLAVRHLGVAMADEDTPAKIEALNKISSFNRSLGSTVPLLIEAQLRARPETTRQAEAAFQAVGDYASYVLKVVGPYANSREPEVAQSAAAALGELGAYGGGALPTLDALIEPDVRDTTAGVAYSAADGITKIDTAVTHLDEQRITVTGLPVGQQPSYTVQQLEEQKSFRRRAADRLADLRSEGERSAAQAQHQLETGPAPVRNDAARELGETGRLLAQVTAALADAERHPVTSTLLHRVSAQAGPANGRQLLPEAALARELPELVAEEGQAPAIALRDSLQAVRLAEQRLAEIAREAKGEPDVLERVVGFRKALERRRREDGSPAARRARSRTGEHAPDRRRGAGRHREVRAGGRGASCRGRERRHDERARGSAPGARPTPGRRGHGPDGRGDGRREDRSGAPLPVGPGAPDAGRAGGSRDRRAGARGAARRA